MTVRQKTETKAAGEEVVCEAQCGESRQEREPAEDQPQDGEHAHLAGITRQFILNLGAGRAGGVKDGGVQPHFGQDACPA